MRTIKLFLWNNSVFKLLNVVQMCTSLVTMFCFHRKEIMINKLLHKSMWALAVSFKAVDKTQFIHCKPPTCTVSLIRMQWTNSIDPDGKIPSGCVCSPETMVCQVELFSTFIPPPLLPKPFSLTPFPSKPLFLSFCFFFFFLYIWTICSEIPYYFTRRGRRGRIFSARQGPYRHYLIRADFFPQTSPHYVAVAIKKTTCTIVC